MSDPLDRGTEGGRAHQSHYTIMPYGPWFEALRPHLTLNQVPTPTRVYDHTLEQPAHRADVLRILALRALGGIYLDLDMYMYVWHLGLLRSSC